MAKRELQRSVYNDPVFRERRRELRRRQTVYESLLWNEVRNRKFDGKKFVRQFSVGPYIVDFFCVKKCLAVELDGIQHETEQKEYDEKRDDFLKGYGVKVLRFHNEEVKNNLSGVLEEIKRNL